jgi:hypothetical protein
MSFNNGFDYSCWVAFITMHARLIAEIECLSRLPQVSLLLLQTPHYLCDERLRGMYGAALHPDRLSHTSELCAAHLSSLTALSPPQARALCADGAFTGANTAKLADRMRRLVKRFTCPDPPPDTSITPPPLSPAAASDGDDMTASTTPLSLVPVPVCLIDLHRRTAALHNCSESTNDGRHYHGAVLLDEVAEMQEYLGRIQ